MTPEPEFRAWPVHGTSRIRCQIRREPLQFGSLLRDRDNTSLSMLCVPPVILQRIGVVAAQRKTIRKP
jgi:hypothetical protein